MLEHRLIPRLTTQQARERYAQIQSELALGASPSSLPQPGLGDAVPNQTGGRAANSADIQRWRTLVTERMTSATTLSKSANDFHSLTLGKAIAEVISPSPSDAAHNGAWSFLSLMVFPDVVYARWPLDARGELPIDRWIGSQAGRDRNYLKLAWRRWQALGPIMERAEIPLGEDEFGALLERSAMARNTRLMRLAAEHVIAYTGGNRMTFTRELMTRLTYLSGPLHLDLLDDKELAELVSETAAEALRDGTVPAPVRARRAAIEDDQPEPPNDDSIRPAPSLPDSVGSEEPHHGKDEPMSLVSHILPDVQESVDPDAGGIASSTTLEAECPNAWGLLNYQEFTGVLPPAEASTEVSSLIEHVLKIISIEGPVTGDRVVRCYAHASDQLNDWALSIRLTRALVRAVESGELVEQDPPRTGGLTSSTFRLPAQPQVLPRLVGPRLLGEIPLRELHALLATLQEVRPLLTTRQLLREAGTALGVSRLTPAAERILRNALAFSS